jgi:arginine exporter protein ArgO
MRGVAGAGLAGVVAGAAVALPLGAIGVLLVREGIDSGWRTASGGALGVALVDGTYAAVAVLAGTTVASALDGREGLIRVGGAIVLAVIAVRGLVAVRRGPPPLEPAGPGGAEVGGAGAARVLARFVLLTALNPLTAVYFVALAAGFGDAVSGPARLAAFLAGVFAASLTWQLVLVSVGALAGARLGERTRTVTTVVGHLVVLGYAGSLLRAAGSG